MTHEGNKKNNLWPHNRLEYYISRLLWRMDVVGDELLAYVDAVDETARIKKKRFGSCVHSQRHSPPDPTTSDGISFKTKNKAIQIRIVWYLATSIGGCVAQSAQKRMNERKINEEINLSLAPARAQWNLNGNAMRGIKLFVFSHGFRLWIFIFGPGAFHSDIFVVVHPLPNDYVRVQCEYFGTKFPFLAE